MPKDPSNWLTGPSKPKKLRKRRPITTDEMTDGTKKMTRNTCQPQTCS
jgi:hypothetical protein